MIQSGYGNKEAILKILYVKKIIIPGTKNDCLKIIMDIYKVIGSIRKLLVIIQMAKE